jgi:hypothetical protein
MGKPILRAILSAAAVVFTLNLLFFNYSLHVILPLLGALLLLLALVGLGDALAGWLAIPADGVLDRAALGMMAAVAYFYLAGFFRVLNRWTVLLFFAAAAAAICARFIFLGSRPSSAKGGRESLRRFLSRPPAEFAVFLVPLVYAALPPTFYDSLVYHLGIPNLYLQSGGFVPTPQFVYANTFIYYEISLIPAVFLGDLVPRLFHFLLGTLFVLAVADEAAERWGVQKKALVVLALASLPMTLFLLVTCKNDLASAIFIFLAIRQFQRGHWKLSAAFWGFAVGVKYFNLLPLAVFLLVAFKPWKKTDLKKGLLTVLIVILAVSPLLVKNFRFTGNPLFPFMQRAFPSAYWDADRFQRLQNDVGKMARTPGDLVRLPYSLSFFNHGYGGLVGPLFLVFLPLLLLGTVRGKRWLVWALLVLAAAPWLTASLRFVYVVFVVLTVFAIRAYEAAAGRLLKAVFYVVIAMNFVMGFAMLEKFYQAHTLLGGTYSLEQYREHFFPAYPAFAYLNRQAPPGAKVLIAGEARNFYLRRPYQLSTALDYCILKKYLLGSGDAGAFVAAMKKDGFSYLVVSFGELDRLQKGYAILSAPEMEKLLKFLGSLAPLFEHGSVRLYRIA